MELYHSEVFMPSNLVLAAKKLMKNAHRARFSRHVQEWLTGIADEDWLRRYKHRYSAADLKNALLSITRTLPDPFEIGVENGEVIKYAVRVHLTEDTDISIVHDKFGVVRTAWLNRVDDIHKTLDTSKYVSEPRFVKTNCKFNILHRNVLTKY